MSDVTGTTGSTGYDFSLSNDFSTEESDNLTQFTEDATALGNDGIKQNMLAGIKDGINAQEQTRMMNQLNAAFTLGKALRY